MATITVTNQKYSQALAGQSVTVTLSGAEADTYLSQIQEGQLCRVTDNDALGTVYSVDYPGISFKVMPIQPNLSFSNGSRGILDENQQIEITL